MGTRTRKTAAAKGRSRTATTTSRPPLELTVGLDREDDGRWFAWVPELPGVIVYGNDKRDALAKVKGLALQVLAELIEHGEPLPGRRAAHALQDVRFNDAIAA